MPEENDAPQLDVDDATAEELLADAVDADTPPDSASGTDEDVAALKADLEKWRGLARKHEDRAKQNAQAASRAKTVEQQVEELRGQLSERDKRELERSGRLAMSHLNARLAEAGIKKDDVAGLLKRITPTDLLADGEPDEAAIGELAESFVRIAGRATPDPDQGKRGGKAPLDMNQLIRRAAGFGS